MAVVAVNELFQSYRGIESTEPSACTFSVADTPDVALISGSGQPGTPDFIPSLGSGLFGDPTFVVDDRQVVGRGADELSIVQVTYRRRSWKGENLYSRWNDPGGAKVIVSSATIAEPFVVPRAIRHETTQGGGQPFLPKGHTFYTSIMPRASTIYTAQVHLPKYDISDMQDVQDQVGKFHDEFNLDDNDGPLLRGLFMGGEVQEIGADHKQIRYQWKIQRRFEKISVQIVNDESGITRDTAIEVGIFESDPGTTKRAIWPHETLGLMPKITEDPATQGVLADPVYYPIPSMNDYQFGNLVDLPGLSGVSAMIATLYDGVIIETIVAGVPFTDPAANIPVDKVGNIRYTVTTTVGQSISVVISSSYPKGGRPVLPIGNVSSDSADVIPAKPGDDVIIKRDALGVLTFKVETEVLDLQPCPVQP